MRKLTTQDRILTLLQTRTQKQAAAKLGVSERTVRRWKNEGVQPTPPHRKTLIEKDQRVRAYYKSVARREGFDAPSLPVQPPAGRQTRWDLKREHRVPSNTVIVDVRKMPIEDQLQAVKAYRDATRRMRAPALRAVHKLSVGHKDHTGRTVTRKRAKRHGSTMWESFEQSRFQSDEGILDWLREVKEIGHILHLVFTMPIKHKRKG